MKNVYYLTLSCLLITLGCSRSQSSGLASKSTMGPSVASEPRDPVEIFVLLSEADRQRVRDQTKNLLLVDLPGGSLCHFIETPEHRVIASVSIPYGPPASRIKNREFQRQLVPASEYFAWGPSGKPIENRKSSRQSKFSDQLNAPLVAESVKNLRRSKMSCRVILCGTPVFDSPENPTFSFEDHLVASDGLLGHPHSPWSVDSKLPTGAQISWLTTSTNWSSALHRESITRFYRVYFKSIGGHLIRMTPAPDLAFSFTEPHLDNDTVRLRDEPPKMIDTEIIPILDREEQDENRVLIPLEPLRVSFQKPGSIKHKIEMAGGEVADLRGEAIILRIEYDGSPSMAPKLAEHNKTILKIAEALPELVESLEIGVAVHRDTGTDLFPVTKIEAKHIDGGSSFDALSSFLFAYKATDGDAKLRDMLHSGMDQLKERGEGKRQFLMVVTDHPELHESSSGSASDAANELLAELKVWCNESSKDRRVIAMFSGSEGPGEEFFQEIGKCSQNSLFSRDPEQLIDALIEAALPH